MSNYIDKLNRRWKEEQGFFLSKYNVEHSGRDLKRGRKIPPKKLLNALIEGCMWGNVGIDHLRDHYAFFNDYGSSFYTYSPYHLTLTEEQIDFINLSLDRVGYCFFPTEMKLYSEEGANSFVIGWSSRLLLS